MHARTLPALFNASRCAAVMLVALAGLAGACRAQIAQAKAAASSPGAAPARVAAPGAAVTASGPQQAAACPPLLSHTFPRLQDDKPQSLCQYAGKVLLVVNTASYCGFTSQYKGLEALHGRYAPRGLVVLGFPSNDFGSQEPGSAREIAQFCHNTYGVRFPMFAKSHVRGDEANAFHRALAQASGSTPKWNFHKYLVARDGRTVQAYTSLTAPDDSDLTEQIEKLLSAR